jgi:hypothetical protein
MVVVTHRPPDDWPRDGVPIRFETSIERPLRLGSCPAAATSESTAPR